MTTYIRTCTCTYVTLREGDKERWEERGKEGRGGGGRREESWEFTGLVDVETKLISIPNN